MSVREGLVDLPASRLGVRVGEPLDGRRDGIYVVKIIILL